MTLTRTLCPLDCGWHHDQPDPAHLPTVEAELRAHLEMHTLEHWTKALANTRGRAIRAERALADIDHLLPVLNNVHDTLTNWKKEQQ